jgi:hypothetical protein
VEIIENKVEVKSAVNWEMRSIFSANPGKELSRINKGIGFRRTRNDRSRGGGEFVKYDFASGDGKCEGEGRVARCQRQRLPPYICRAVVVSLRQTSGMTDPRVCDI